MKEDYILNHYGKNTELSMPEISFEEDNEEKRRREALMDKEETKELIKSIFLPKKDSLSHIKDNKFFFVALGIFIFVTIINMILRKEYFFILGTLLAIYITLILAPINYKLENSRYVDVSMWNLNSSFRMVSKSIFGDLLIRINYIKLVSYSSVVFLISCAIGSIPLASIFTVFSFFVLCSSYMVSFYHGDVDVIKESLNTVCFISPMIIIGFSLIGGLALSSACINIVGYILWIVLHKFKNLIEGYSFKEMQKEVY